MKFKKLSLIFVGLSLSFSLLGGFISSLNMEQASTTTGEYLAELNKSEKSSTDNFLQSSQLHIFLIPKEFQTHSFTKKFYSYLDINTLFRPPINL